MKLPMQAVAAGLVVSFAAVEMDQPARRAQDMKRAVTQLYEEWISTGQLDGIDELVSPEYRGPNDMEGPAAFRANVEHLRTGFPDLRFTVDDLIAEGDKVTMRWTWRGTHTGRFRAFEPTGRSVTATGIVIYRFRDGKIVEGWLETDRLGVIEQLQAR